MSELMMNMEQSSLEEMKMNQLTAEVLFLKQQTAQNIIEIGKRLIEAKSKLGEGETFSNWLKNGVNFSKSTAYNFMKVAQEFDDVQALGKLGQTKVFALLSVPQEERENFIIDHDVENMSTRELQKAIKEREQALKEKEDIEKLLNDAMCMANEKSDEAQKLLEEKQKLESEKRIADKVLRETQEDIKKLQEALKEERAKSKEEVNRLQASIEDTKKLLSEAHASGDNEEAQRLQEVIKDKEDEIANSHKKIEELERQLKEKPIEVQAAEVIEKIPAEVEKELQELRHKAHGGAATVKYSIFFGEVVKGFKEMLGTLEEIKGIDEAEYNKYKNAARGLLNKMLEQL